MFSHAGKKGGGGEFLCLFFEYNTFGFLSANTYILNSYFHAYSQYNLKRMEEIKDDYILFLSLPPLPIAANRSFESQKSSILCRTI